MTNRKPNRYERIIERIFELYYEPGAREIRFERTAIETVAHELGIILPKYIGDILYSFRYRAALPESISSRAPDGEAWIIRAVGRAQYAFVCVTDRPLAANPHLTETKVPDSTPGVVAKYALGDEQALLARLRYNRLIDIFTGVACYSLQNHLRTTVPSMGQVETDEIYVGVDRRGVHFVFPVQAKKKRDTLNIVQIEQDVAVCLHKFPELVPRPIAAQFMRDEVIALFEFEEAETELVVLREAHYRLVPPEQVSADDLARYRERPDNT